MTWAFLSTPSVRRATTQLRSELTEIAEFLSTPSVRRATVVDQAAFAVHHAFLSTPSVRRATLFPGRYTARENISIHALREEGDAALAPPVRAAVYFYPRPP